MAVSTIKNENFSRAKAKGVKNVRAAKVFKRPESAVRKIFERSDYS